LRSYSKFAIMEPMQVLFYQTTNGRSPVTEELDSLPTQASAHAYELLDGIESHGLGAPRVVFRQIEGKLWEIKMNLPQTGGYRIFYCLIEAGNMLLLHAYAKKSQKAPKKELETAWRRLLDAQKRGV
jgi:phage-related protein